MVADLDDNDMEELCFFSPSLHKPSYANVVKKGGKGASSYAAAAAKLATSEATTKNQRAPTKSRITTDPNKLYVDSAATYPSLFVKWYLKNVRDVEKNLRGNCNPGVKVCSQVGDLGIFKMWLKEGRIANLFSIL